MNSSGYVLNAKTGTCDDINECVVTPDACGAYGQCMNETGTFSCRCHAGYSLNIPGRSLVALTGDVMHKARTNQGGRSSVGISDDRNWQIFALNQETSRYIFHIRLFSKFFFRSRTGERSDQFKCIDDDECHDGNNYCVDDAKGGICVNIDGSFTCTCKAGYEGDGNDYQKYSKLTQTGPVSSYDFLEK